jgi:hypothetical protein
MTKRKHREMLQDFGMSKDHFGYNPQSVNNESKHCQIHYSKLNNFCIIKDIINSIKR